MHACQRGNSGLWTVFLGSLLAVLSWVVFRDKTLLQKALTILGGWFHDLVTTFWALY